MGRPKGSTNKSKESEVEEIQVTETVTVPEVVDVTETKTDFDPSLPENKQRHLR